MRAWPCHSPTSGSAEGAPLTAGWLLMVSRPEELSAMSRSLIFCVSRCKPPSITSLQGLLASSPEQYLAKSCSQAGG